MVIGGVAGGIISVSGASYGDVEHSIHQGR